MICSLFKFPPLPTFGMLTLCEVEGKLQCMPAEFSNVESFTNAVSGHPKVSITRELLHHTPGTRDDIGRVFVPVTDPFFKRIISIWYEQGLMSALQTVSTMRDHEAPRAALITAKFLTKLTNAVAILKNSFHPHLRESGERLISAVSQTREWPLSPVRCLEWHPHTTKLAVGAWDDSVRVYTTDSSLVPVLKCKNQSSISCLAWRPCSASELAVGCQEGVFLWTVDPNSVVTRPSMACAKVLTQSGHRPITSLAWSPNGGLLLTSSAADTVMYVWDVDTERAVPLRRVGGGGVCLVTWSPDGSKLFAATAGAIFRVWKTEKWSPERWTTLNGRVQAACWSPCGSVLLFATTEEALVYALPFDAVGSVFKADDLRNASPVIDLTPLEVDCMEGAETSRVGGVVTSMTWDRRGHHLALMFRDSNVVAVFRTEIVTSLRITPSCFINGLPGETPSAINFQKDFDEGSVLTVAWSTGRLQHFPFVYTDLELEDESTVMRPLATSFHSPRSSAGLQQAETTLSPQRTSFFQ